MKKFFTLVCLGASLCGTAMAAETVHQGQGMSGENAYSEVTFTNAQDGTTTKTAKVVYTLTATADNNIAIEAKFENLDPATFIGLVDAGYFFVEGVGETPLTLADGVYTATTAGTFTEGTAYKGFFKRMSAADWYGGSLEFPFEFTFTKGGEEPGPGPEPTDPTEGRTPKNVYNAPETIPADNIFFAPGWNASDQYSYTLTADAATFVLTAATFERWQAQFKIPTGVSFTAEDVYQLEFDYKADNAFTGHVKLYQNGADGTFAVDQDLTMTAEVQHFKSPVYTNKPLENVILLFDWGGNPANTTIEVTNIKLIKYVTGDEPEPATTPEQLYLNGAIVGWVEPSEANADKFADYILAETEKGSGIYTGEFEFEAKENNSFRFYSKLDGWDNSSIGASQDDKQNPFTFTDNVYEGEIFIGGKGSWQLPDDFAGKVKMTVNLTAMTVKFEAEQKQDSIDAVEAEAAETVYYNLQGVRVANPENGIFIKVAGNKVEKVIR